MLHSGSRVVNTAPGVRSVVGPDELASPDTPHVDLAIAGGGHQGVVQHVQAISGP